MPYIFSFVKYPPTVAVKVAEKYLEAMQKNPVPDYVKRLVPAATRDTLDGVLVINIDEVKEADLGKALKYLNMFIQAFRDFEGLTWEFKTFATVPEGLSYLGLVQFLLGFRIKFPSDLSSR